MAKRDISLTSSQKAINEIARIKNPKSRTGIRGVVDRARTHRLNKMKINKIADLGKASQRVGIRGIDAMKDIAKTYIATDTAKELSRPQGFSSSLQAWTKNFSGNPDTKTGQDGETQTGSTTNMYNELGGI